MSRTLHTPVTIGLGLVVALLLLSASLAYRNTRQLNDDATWVTNTQVVLNLTSDVMLTLVDAETGMRGFPIVGKDEFLRPYDAALVRLDGLGVAGDRDAPRQQAIGTDAAFRRVGGSHPVRACAPRDARHRRNGGELPVPFGGPLRMRVPRQLGYKSTKYVTRLVVTDSLAGFGTGKGSADAEGGYSWYAGI